MIFFFHDQLLLCSDVFKLIQTVWTLPDVPALTFLGQVLHLEPPGVSLLQLLQEAGSGVTPAQEGIGTGRLRGAVPAVRGPRVVELHQQAVHDGGPAAGGGVPADPLL